MRNGRADTVRLARFDSAPGVSWRGFTPVNRTARPEVR